MLAFNYALEIGDIKAIIFMIYPLLVLYSTSEKSAEIILGNKVLEWLGKISFGIFIMHQPLQLWWVLCNGALDISLDYNNIYVFLMHMCVCVIGGAMYYYTEKQIHEKCKQGRSI